MPSSSTGDTRCAILTLSQAKDGSFEVLAPDKRYVFVSSDMHLRELDKAPDTVLSLQAASKQV
jgi:hypothetical protein